MKTQNCSRNRLAKRQLALFNLQHREPKEYPSGYDREAEMAILEERIAHPEPVFTKKSCVERAKLMKA